MLVIKKSHYFSIINIYWSLLGNMLFFMFILTADSREVLENEGRERGAMILCIDFMASMLQALRPPEVLIIYVFVKSNLRTP